jgi:hypothetical protein
MLFLIVTVNLFLCLSVIIVGILHAITSTTGSTDNHIRGLCRCGVWYDTGAIEISCWYLHVTKCHYDTELLQLGQNEVP